MGWTQLVPMLPRGNAVFDAPASASIPYRRTVGTEDSAGFNLFESEGGHNLRVDGAGFPDFPEVVTTLSPYSVVE